MNIGMILAAEFPPDIRVEKESRSLVADGFCVHLLCLARGAEHPQESYRGITIHRFREVYPTNALVRKLLLGYETLTHSRTAWLTAMLDFVARNQVDVLHVHDLPLVATAIAVKKKTHIPVVADLHENYPAALAVWNDGLKVSWKGRLTNSPNRWAKHEARVLEEVDRIIVVVDEAKARLVSLGLPADKIKVVPNTEALEFWHRVELDEGILDRFRDSFVVSYIGGFGPHRGIDCAVKAMRFITPQAPEVKLLLVGKEGWYGEQLERMAREHGVSEAVEFIPWVPIEKAKSYIEATDVGLVPHNSNPHTEATVPHKLFQYMLFGKPVVVSSCRPLKRIAEETGAGLVFEAGDAEDLARKVLALYRSSQLRRAMAGRGKQAAIQGKYSWEQSTQELVGLYKTLSLATPHSNSILAH